MTIKPLRDRLAYLYFSYLERKGQLRSLEPEWHLLSQLLNLDDVVIDVGANIGRYSLRCSDLVGPNGSVIAIEPNSRIRNIANLLSRQKKFANICFVEACVSDASGIALFQEDWSAPKSAFFSTATRSKMMSSPLPIMRQTIHHEVDQQKRTQKIQKTWGRKAAQNIQQSLVTEKLQITIDQLSVKPSLIKIDVEGHEISVVKGGINTIKQFTPLLIIEDNDADYNLLIDLGYTMIRLIGSRNIIFCHDSDERRGVIRLNS